MCGIVGILGRAPVAEQLVDSLKRLEYRGYDSAGVATLEGNHLERRRAEGKLKNLEARLARKAARRPYRHRPHPLGHPRQADRKQRASACDRTRRRGPQRHHREFSRAARGAGEKGRGLQDRDRHRDRAAPRRRHACSNGVKPVEAVQGVAVAAARRVRARLHLCRRRRSDDRRAQRPAARDRLWRGRNVSRLRRDCARPVHRHHQLSRGRRLGGADAQRRHDLRQERRHRAARGDQALGRDLAGRQGELPPLHGQGNPRAAGSGRPHAGAATSTWRPSG